MSDTTADAGQPDFDAIDADAEEAAPEKAPGRLKRFAIIGAALLLVLGGVGGGAAYFLGMFGGSGDAVAAPPVFYELPEMTVNLSTVDERPQYLKIRAALEMRDREVLSAIEPVMPRVLDAFQVYLRELRATDLEGSAGLYRLKEELVRRVNLAIHPAEIDNVAFNEIIVQ